MCAMNVSTRKASLGESLRQWLIAEKSRLRPSTFRQMEYSAHRWRDFWGERKAGDLSRADIEDYLAAYAEVHAPSTTVLELSVLRAYWRWAKTHGHTRADPTEGVRAPRLVARTPRSLSAADTAKLLEAARDAWEAALDRGLPTGRALLYPVLLIAQSTLLRIGSILSLAWEDIDWENGAIRLPGHVSKTGEPVAVPMTQLVRETLERLAPGRAGTSGPVFPDLGYQKVYLAFRRICRRAGVNASFHDFRRSGATALLEMGIPLPVVQRLGGWKSPATVLRYYASASDTSVRRASEALAELCNGAQGAVQNQPGNA